MLSTHYLFCLSLVCHNQSVLRPAFQFAGKTIQSIKHILSANSTPTACLASSLIICRTCSLSPERWCFAFCNRLVVFPITSRFRFNWCFALWQGGMRRAADFPVVWGATTPLGNCGVDPPGSPARPNLGGHCARCGGGPCR